MNDAMAAELKRILGCEELPKECEQWDNGIWGLAVELARSKQIEIAYVGPNEVELIMIGPVNYASRDALLFSVIRGLSVGNSHDKTTKRHPLYETQLRLIGKLKAAIGSDDGKREGEPVDVALERIVDAVCSHIDIVRKMERRLSEKLITSFGLAAGSYFGRVEDALADVVDDVCKRHLEVAPRGDKSNGFTFPAGPTVDDGRCEKLSQQREQAAFAAALQESDYAATVKALSEAIQVLAKEQKQTYASCNTLSNTLAEVVKQRMKLEVR